jgi:hypothetical protein
LGLSHAAPLSPAASNHNGKEINNVDPIRHLSKRELIELIENPTFKL